MNEAPVREGDVLAGKYRVERVLGVGGMGVVVAATHLQLDERVALKFLTADALLNGEAVARFAREARAAVKIKSEHVARVIDVGTLPETGAPYMVMEYLDGADLSQVLTQRGALPIEEAVEYVLQACEAIAHAHVLGIVHRDLKPANLFLIRRPDGTNAVKVLDFGISKVMPGRGSSDHAMTRTSTVMGSPLYMSPEQMASSRNVDARTDIWALGAILYELLSGDPPFNAETLPQLVATIMSGIAPSVRAIKPSVPPGLDAAIKRCLEKDLARRYGNVSEFANGLADFGPRRSRASVERIGRVVSGSLSQSNPLIGELAAAEGGAPTQVQTGGTWAETRTNGVGKGARKWLWGAIGVIAVGAAAVVALARRSPAPLHSETAAMSAGLAAPSTSLAQVVPLLAPAASSASPVAPAASIAAPVVAAANPHVPEVAEPVAARPPSGKPVKRPAGAGAPRPAALPPAAPPPRPAADLFDDRK